MSASDSPEAVVRPVLAERRSARRARRRRPATSCSELERDGRISNKELAALVGVAPSTCHARVRALRESGVLRGFHAQVDPEAVGRGLQAMIAVRLQAAARARLAEVAHRLAQRPEVRDVYLLAGVDDVLVHVAVRDSPELRGVRAGAPEHAPRGGAHADQPGVRARPRTRAPPSL